MAQATVFPVRFGLQLPPPENVKAVEVFSEGGLDLTQSIIENRPGCASVLYNYEASLTGGYRRINGYVPYSNTVVPGQGQILGVAVVWPSYVVAARQDATFPNFYNLYYSTGTTWTQINPPTSSQSGSTNATTTVVMSNTAGLIPGQPISSSSGDIPAGAYIVSITDTSHLVISIAATGTHAGQTITTSNPLSYTAGMTFQTTYYNWTGVIRQAFFDSVNFSYRWDFTEGMVMFVGTAANPAPKGAVTGREYFGYLVMGGFGTNNAQIAWSAPNADTDWTPADGSATVIVGDIVTGLSIWRQQLIILGKTSLNRMVPNTLNTTGIASPPPFQIQPITDRIGCFDGRTAKEIDGDVVFLSPDGVRTVSGTVNIGDTEIGSISRSIQSIVTSITPSTIPCNAVVCRKKTQYRLFYVPTGIAEASAPGIMGSVRRFRDGHEGWEWTQLRGIKVSCADSNFLSDGNEYVIHGGYDGYVYRQEQGNVFLDGSGISNSINEYYTTVPLELGDEGLRKAPRHVTLYINSENGPANVLLNVVYDYGTNVIQPTPISISTGADTNWDNFTWDSGSKWDSSSFVLIRKAVQGSGFAVQLSIRGSGIGGNPHTIQGYYVEFYPAGRR